MTATQRQKIDNDLAQLERDNQVERIAIDFVKRLRAALTPRQIALVRTRNWRETNPNVCHSHDFCDANVYMAEAFEHVMKRTVLNVCDCTDPAKCAGHEDKIQAECDMMNDAWALAKPRI